MLNNGHNFITFTSTPTFFVTSFTSTITTISNGRRSHNHGHLRPPYNPIIPQRPLRMLHLHAATINAILPAAKSSILIISFSYRLKTNCYRFLLVHHECPLWQAVNPSRESADVGSIYKKIHIDRER